MIFKRIFAVLTAGTILTAMLLSNVSAKPDKENLLFIGDDITSGKNADAASIEMISDYLGMTLTNDTASEMTSSQCLSRIKNRKDDIKNADTIILSAGFFDFVNPFLEIIYSYREGDESFDEVKAKMKRNLSTVVSQFSEILNQKEIVIDTTSKAINEIKKTNPDADIYYLSCYNPFNAYTNDATYALLNGQINNLLTEFYTAIDSIEGVTCINIFEAYYKNEGAYTNVLNYDVYPSTAGQLKIASSVLTNITQKDEKEILSNIAGSSLDSEQITALPDVIRNDITLPAETTAPIITTAAATTTPKATTAATTTTPKVTTAATTTTAKVTTAATTTTTKATTAATTTTTKATTAAATTTKTTTAATTTTKATTAATTTTTKATTAATTTTKATTAATTTAPKVTTVVTTTTPKVTTVVTTTTKEDVYEYLPNDIDKNGVLNAEDLFKLGIVLLSDISEAEKAKYDLNNDKKTDINDFVYLKKILINY